MSSNVASITGVTTETVQPQPSTIHLNLEAPQPENVRRVAFQAGTVDNEGMDKRKSKCCCIFTKQRLFDESSSEDDDACPDHCHGKKGWHKKKKDKSGEHNCDQHESEKSDQVKD